MRRLLVGSFLVSLAMGAIGLFLPIYAAEELGANYTEVGLLGVMYVVFNILFSIPAGVLGDRFGRKPFLLAGVFMTSLSFFLYSMCGEVWQILAVRLYQGMAEAPIWVNMQAAIAELSEERSRGRAMGLYGTSWAAGFGVGPMLAGWFFPSFGARAGFIFGAVLALISAIPVALSNLPLPKATRCKLNFGKLLPLCFATLIYIGVVAIFYTLLPAYAVVGIGLSEFQTGTLITLFTVVRGVAFAPLGSLSDRVGARRIILTSILASSLISLGIALTTGYPSLLFLSFLLAVAEGAVYPAVISSISKICEHGNLGLVLGVFNSVGMVGWGLFPGVGGRVADLYGPTAPFLMFTVVSLLSLPVLYRLLK